MGRKVHPIGFRLKINRPWESGWFGEGSRYTEMLHEDFAIRRLLMKEGAQAAIAKVEVDRYPSQVVVTIHTAKPGIVIGQEDPHEPRRTDWQEGQGRSRRNHQA
jgi:small subunit ribosomal protein S3